MWYSPAAMAEHEPEHQLVESLRRGDEEAFTRLVECYSPSLLRVAITFVPSRAVAEEVVQETWVGVLDGVGRFEGRSLFKTWLFQILVNRAKSRGVRERRYVPFASTTSEGSEGGGEEAVEASRFHADGHWRQPPRQWDRHTPERLLLGREALEQIERAIGALPDQQRQVITLRDVEGLEAGEVCNMLEISETNQRVLLHRARARVRQALERYLQHESERAP
jgi:RNA polymerase sigma-70 factor, ECF subfamily